MAKETLIRHNAADYNIAVQTIKEAILRSQYQAAKLVNREMLSLYYGLAGMSLLIQERDSGAQMLLRLSLNDYAKSYQGLRDSRQQA